MKNSSPPRRPPGPPPPRAPPPDVPQQLSGIKRPPGQPPGISAPLAALKPPPAFAPTDLPVPSSAQRPGFERAVKRKVEESAETAVSIAPPKTAAPPVATYKAGGISMFEGSEEKSEKAQITAAASPAKMEMLRSPRPLPPRMPTPGIPEGQPLPPPVTQIKSGRPPPPIRPPPKSVEGGRAPPKDDPEAVLKLAAPKPKQEIVPPTSEPPLLRVKKVKDEKDLKRRDRAQPEFEESDDEDDGPQLVKQPLPFGVIKLDPKKALEDAPSSSDAQPGKEASSVISKQVALKGQDTSTAATAPTATSALKKRDELPASSPISPSDIIAGEFTPAAPSSGVYFDASKIGATLPRGRLSIRCIEGLEIRKKDDLDRNPRCDPYIKFRLGAAERHPWKSTGVKRKQDTNPKFDNEVVSFSMLDPFQYVFDEDVQLCIELWNKSVTKNDMIASVSMSVIRFLQQPFVAYTEKVPIYYPGATRTSMKLVLEIVFEEAKCGLAQLTIYEGKSLRNIDPLGQQDPYVRFTLGQNYVKRTKSVKGGGTAPYFGEEQILMWIDQENWIEDLVVDVLDEDAKDEKPIGSTRFSLLPYMNIAPAQSKDDSYPLFYTILTDPNDDATKKEIPSGHLILRVCFLPAGKLTITVDRAKGLLMPETVIEKNPRIDPYVQLTLDGLAVQIIKKSPADKDGGADPVWENDIVFDIVDQYNALLEVYHQSFIGKDILIGTAEVSLLSAYRNGKYESWITLKQKKVNGGIREVGDIFLKMTFIAPGGIAFPQLRPDIDSFDDALRKLPADKPTLAAAQLEEEVVEAKPIISTIPEEGDAEGIEAPAEGDILDELQKPEFNEDEIMAAFRFIDLDRNNFIGAAEIRHILVCMGEMITDEEIDMMISMVDLDGDGQVSFQEFRALVLHPNPAAVDMHKEINRQRDQEIMKDKQALAGKTTGMDLTSFQRQREMLAREEKKKMLLSFIADNELDFESIRLAYSQYLEIPKERRLGGRVNFMDFCKIMSVEPITEYKNLHKYYDDDETGTMDIREFLLSLMNFVQVAKDDRIKFSFEIFDELKTDFITQQEVAEILRGNHMLGLSSVQRKAETILKQSNSTQLGRINLKEFLIVSKKFPNVLFPTAGILSVPKGTRTAAPTAVLIS